VNIHIETERLIFRDIEDSDVEGMYALDSDSEVHRYLGGKPIKSVDAAQRIINNIGSNKILSRSGMKLTETFDFDGSKHNWYSAKTSC